MPVAENTCRINVWRTSAEARTAYDNVEAAGGECRLLGRMTIYPTMSEAKANVEDSGGSVNTYVAGAVHVDSDVVLAIQHLACSNTKLFSMAYWVNFSGGRFPGGNDSVFLVSGGNNYGAWNSNGAPFFGLLSSNTSIGEDIYTTVGMSLADWHSVVMSIDTISEGVGSIAIDGVSVPVIFGSWTTAFDIYLNSQRLEVFYGNVAHMDFADIRIAPGQNWLTDGIISSDTLALFIDADGRPVDPAIATAALGVPAVLCSGDALTFGTNQGTGGTFTLTGTLTDASSSPSDVGRSR